MSYIISSRIGADGAGAAVSSGALVSKGRFVGLCLRFARDFEASLDDWKPEPQEACVNVCCVSEGTYEVCSRTAAARHNGKQFFGMTLPRNIGQRYNDQKIDFFLNNYVKY